MAKKLQKRKKSKRKHYKDLFKRTIKYRNLRKELNVLLVTFELKICQILPSTVTCRFGTRFEHSPNIRTQPAVLNQSVMVISVHILNLI